MAIRKISAYRLCTSVQNIKKADGLLLNIYETVNKQKEDAIEARKEAEKQTKIAIKQRKIAEANYLISESKSEIEKNPTLALRLSEAAMRINNDIFNENVSLKIYRENSFYRNIYNENTNINSIAFSPDKNKFVVGTERFDFQLRDLRGNVIEKFNGHTGAINSVIFSPSGDTIFTGSKDSTMTMWDLNGNILQQFKGHSGSVTCVSISPSGKNILTGSTDSTARLWDLRGNTLKVFKGHSERIWSVDFSPEHKILTKSWDRTARLWDFSNDQFEIKVSIKFPTNAIFSPNGKTILSFEKHSAFLSDLEGTTIKEFNDTLEFINKIAFSPNGESILTWYSNAARLWDLNGNARKKFIDDSKYIQSLEFSPDGKTILACYQKNARLWNLTGNIVQEFNSPDYKFSYAGFLFDKKKLFTISGNSVARLWGMKSVKAFKCPSVGALTFSPDGKKILVGSWDKKVRLFDSDGNTLQEFCCHNNGITSVAFSPTGDTILSGSNDRTAYLWNTQGDTIKVFRGHSGKILSVAFSPDGSKILTGSNDNTARIWELNGGYKEFNCNSFVTCVAFSPNKKLILLACANGITHLLDINMNPIKEFKAHSGYITSASFSPSGKSIMTGSLDFTARLSDLKGKAIQEFKIDNIVSAVAFSRDGNSILTCSGSNARLWNLKGNILQEFESYSGPIVSAAFSADGKRILTGSTSDKVALLWELALPLKDFLQSNEIEPLSKKQKQLFNIMIP